MKISIPYTIIIPLLLCVGVFSPWYVTGQEEWDSGQAYMWFDDIIGRTNSGIFKGVVNTQEYRVINERHHFFKEPYFVLGWVVYDNQPYFKVKLRYNVYDDQLSIKNGELDRLPIMVFDRDKISEFKIGPHRFKNLGLTEPDGNANGFFEVLMEKDSLILFKKHRKKRFKRTDEQILYYEFKDEYTFHLKWGGNFHILNKAKDLNRIFPRYKRELKAIRNRHASLRNSNLDQYMKAILLEVYGLLSPENTGLRS